MGYSHYFKAIKPVPDDKWDAVLEAKDKIVKFASDFVDIDDLSFLKDININGVGDDAHENLYIDPEALSPFSFCKTARKPYDVVIVAILCVINDICGDCFKITSDGDREDWEAGRALASDALGDFYNIPVTI